MLLHQAVGKVGTVAKQGFEEGAAVRVLQEDAHGRGDLGIVVLFGGQFPILQAAFAKFGPADQRQLFTVEG